MCIEHPPAVLTDTQVQAPSPVPVAVPAAESELGPRKQMRKTTVTFESPPPGWKDVRGLPVKYGLPLKRL